MNNNDYQKLLSYMTDIIYWTDRINNEKYNSSDRKIFYAEREEAIKQAKNFLNNRKIG